MNLQAKLRKEQCVYCCFSNSFKSKRKFTLNHRLVSPCLLLTVWEKGAWTFT